MMNPLVGFGCVACIPFLVFRKMERVKGIEPISLKRPVGLTLTRW
jgi:hypothetical protein